MKEKIINSYINYYKMKAIEYTPTSSFFATIDDVKKIKDALEIVKETLEMDKRHIVPETTVSIDEALRIINDESIKPHSTYFNMSRYVVDLDKEIMFNFIDCDDGSGYVVLFTHDEKGIRYDLRNDIDLLNRMWKIDANKPPYIA